MYRVRYLAVLLVVVGSCAADTHDNSSDRFARLVSHEFRKLDDRRRELLAISHPRPPLARCPNLGYHSRTAHAPNSPRWVQVDLGTSQPIDTVIIVPAAGPRGDSGPGYYFPPELRVELANHPDASDAVTVAEVKETGEHPLVVPVGGRVARFVRITATKLVGRDGLYFFALGELIALAGNLNVAAGRSVIATDSIENAPVWSMQNLVDGQSVVGSPVSTDPSTTNGYHAEISSIPNAVKWVQVDLGTEHVLDEVRLIPARPRDFADRSGFGFPARFRVESAHEPTFRTPTVLFDATTSDYPNPGDGLVTIYARGITARYIRITATKLWERTGDFVFALAELQVYSGGVNVAVGTEVTAYDSIERGLWSKRYLVDGFASQNRLLEWPNWAAREREAAEHDAELQVVEADWERVRGVANARLVNIAGGLVGVIVLFAGGLVWRLRVLRRRDADRLRDRITHDLHDEVGSNLGGILLLAQAGNADDLPAIARIARETAESMRDLVWLMGRESDTGADLLAHMRETAGTLLVGVEWALEATDDVFPRSVSLDFKRQMFFAFKEMLHNIAKHAAARTASIRIWRDGQLVKIEVRDDGRGFDLNTVKAGTGLRSLRVRAVALGGEVHITSALGKGTTVQLSARI